MLQAATLAIHRSSLRCQVGDVKSPWLGDVIPGRKPSFCRQWVSPLLTLMQLPHGRLRGRGGGMTIWLFLPPVRVEKWQNVHKTWIMSDTKGKSVRSIMSGTNIPLPIIITLMTVNVNSFVCCGKLLGSFKDVYSCNSCTFSSNDWEINFYFLTF